MVLSHIKNRIDEAPRLHSRNISFFDNGAKSPVAEEDISHSSTGKHPWSSAKGDKNAKAYLLVAIILYILLFSVLNFLKYQNFGYNGMDLGIIHQVFYNSGNGNFFASSIHSPTYLGDHFSPILFLILPIYIIYKHPLTLLIIQNIFLAIGALPIFFIAKKYFSPHISLAIAIAWLLNPMVQNISMYEFSFLPFALPFLFFAIYFYLKNKFVKFFICILFALLAREDVSLFVLMFGVLSLIEKRGMKWISSSSLIAISYFIVSMGIIDMYNPEGGYKFFIYYSWLGSMNPIQFIFHFFSIANMEMILGILMPFAFLPIVKPKYLLFAIPIYGQIFFMQSNPGVIVLKTHYGALLLPPLFLAFIYALKKCKEIKETSAYNKIQYKASILDKTNFIILFLKEPLGIFILVVASFYSFFTLGPVLGTISKNIFAKDAMAISEKNSLLAKIPPKSAAASSYDFLVQLSSREKIYSLNYFYLGQEQLSKTPYDLPSDTEYLMINFSDFISYELQYKNNPIYQEGFLYGDNRVREKIEKDHYGIVGIFDDVALLKKNYREDLRLYNIFLQEPKISTIKRESLGEELTFLGYNISLITPRTTTINEEGLGFPVRTRQLAGKEGVRVIPIELFWKANQDIKKNYYMNFQLKDSSKKIIYEKPYLLGYGIFPSNKWDKDQIIQTNYWPYIPSAVPSGVYEVFLEIFEIQDGGVFFDSDLSIKNYIYKKEVFGEAIEIEKIKL